MNEQINSMFEVATRKKIRFSSCRGELSLEDLWDVPLRSRDKFNLDAVAKTISQELKTYDEESFVETRKTVAQTKAELQLDIVKYVIETKLNEEESAKNRAETKKELDKLKDLLAKKEDEALMDLTTKQIKKKIKDLQASV